MGSPVSSSPPVSRLAVESAWPMGLCQGHGLCTDCCSVPWKCGVCGQAPASTTLGAFTVCSQQGLQRSWPDWAVLMSACCSRIAQCQQSVWGSCGFSGELGDLEVRQESWRSMLLLFISSREMCFNYSELINCSSWIVQTVSQEHGDIHGHDFTDAAFCLQSWALHLVCTLGMLQ